MSRIISLCHAVLLSCCSLAAQVFSNLGFDDANTNSVSFEIYVSPVQPPNPAIRCMQGVGPASELLTSWELFQGTEQRLFIDYNYVSVVTPTLIEKDVFQFSPLSHQVEGRYSLRLGSEIQGSALFEIHQRSIIPPDAGIFQFLFSGRLPILEINNTAIPTIVPVPIISLEPLLVKYDVSQFSGDIVDLTIREGAEVITLADRGLVLDSLAFVPEPTPLELLVFSGAAVVLIRVQRLRASRGRSHERRRRSPIRIQ
jgi:hypothetical protein